MSTVIYNGSDITVLFDYVSNDGVVFSFSGFGAYKTEKHAYADGFIQKLGLSAVFFLANHDHWWQSSELDEAIEIANIHTALIHKRISYGQSMGGYGALLASKKLKSLALVTAPQTCISNPLIPLHPVWKENISRFPLIRDDIAECVEQNLGTIVLYDNLCNLDKKHFDYIANKKGVIGIRVSFGTHYIPKVLSEMRIFSQIISILMLDNGHSPQQIRCSIRRSRILSKTYIDSMSMALKRRNHPKLQSVLVRKCQQALLNGNEKQNLSHIFEYIIDDVNKNKVCYKFYCSNILMQSTNNQTLYFDERSGILESIGNDPGFYFSLYHEDDREGFKEVSISLYCSVDCYAILYFTERATNRTFSEAYSLRKEVKKGYNYLIFDVSKYDIEPKLRFDPIRQPGLFQIQNINFK